MCWPPLSIYNMFSNLRLCPHIFPYLFKTLEMELFAYFCSTASSALSFVPTGQKISNLSPFFLFRHHFESKFFRKLYVRENKVQKCILLTVYSYYIEKEVRSFTVLKESHSPVNSNRWRNVKNVIKFCAMCCETLVINLVC